jgi:hypothetical protein
MAGEVLEKYYVESSLKMKYPLMCIFLFLPTFSSANSILFGPNEKGPWYFGINSELFAFYTHRAANYNQTFASIKPYVEYQRSSLLVSPNLRLEIDDAFMLTIGGEVGPTFYFGEKSSVGYNIRFGFTLLKIAQVNIGLRSTYLLRDSHVIADFAFGLHYPIFQVKNQK